MVASRLQRSPALVRSPVATAAALPSAARPRHRPVEGTFAEQEAALAPAPTDADKASSEPARSPDLARNNRASGAPAVGQPLLRCGDPRFDGRPVTEARDAVVSMLTPYLEVGPNFVHYAANMRATEIAHRRRMVELSPLGGLAEDSDLDSGRWQPVIDLATRMNALVLNACLIAEHPGKVCEASRVGADAMAAFQRFSAAFDAAAAETRDEIAANMSLLSTVQDVATAVAAGATFIMIAAGVVYFGPAILAGAANASAVGGTVTAAGKAAVMGGTMAGGTRMVGTALGGGTVDQVGQAGIDGAKAGAVDAIAAVGPVPGTVSSAGEIIGGAAMGALGSASQAASQGQSVPAGLLLGAAGNVLQAGVTKGALRN